MSRPHTSAEANAALLRAAFTAFNAHDLDACLPLLAPNIVINLAELPTPLHGRDTWLAVTQLMKTAFPDLRAHIDDIVAANDRVALRLSFTGTHTGPFQGYPPTGRPVRYVSHEFYRITDDLIAEEWICSDTASLFAQLR
jgi:steroid delta-isomerase-like uncharacterized protein